MDGSSGPDCPRCGARLEPLDERGSLDCVRCWFALAQGSEPPRFAGYQRLDVLGRGGSAVVHLAREPGANRLRSKSPERTPPTLRSSSVSS
jgi:hypothetical protein